MYCPYLPVPLHGELSESETLAEENVTVTCDKGHLISPGQSNMTIKCFKKGEIIATVNYLGVVSYSDLIHFNDVFNYFQLTTFLSAVTCPPVPMVPNATISTTLTLIDTVVTLSCPQGQWFPQKQTAISIRCLPTRTWSQVPGVCKGILHLVM